jgi:hypothetical protein
LAPGRLLLLLLLLLLLPQPLTGLHKQRPGQGHTHAPASTELLGRLFLRVKEVGVVAKAVESDSG